MNALYAALAVGAAIILLPAVIAGAGFVLAILGIVALAVLLFGGREAIDLYKHRQEGVSAAKASQNGETSDRSWRDRDGRW